MQPTISAQALTQLQANQAGSKGAGDFLTDANNTAGVGGAQDTVTGLRSSIDTTTKLLNQVPPSVMGRTGGSLVTNAQATKQISNEQAPISKNLTALGSQYTEAGQNLNTLKSQAAQEANLGYQSQQDKQSYLQNLYNTMYTKEQNATQAANTLAQQAESKRQFDVNAANTAAANASKSSAVSSTPSASQNMAEALTSKAGADGYVAPGTYQALKSQWTAGGYGDAA